MKWRGDDERERGFVLCFGCLQTEEALLFAGWVALGWVGRVWVEVGWRFREALRMGWDGLVV